MKHLRQCPATHLHISDGKIQESVRCQREANHSESHRHDGHLWSFVEGSYSGLAEDHPDYGKRVSV